jgi:hypothetical protein
VIFVLNELIALPARPHNRGIASFALVPNKTPYSLTSEFALVTPDGDIEMHSIHDAPKHPMWSSRGDLAIGSGIEYRIFPGYKESEPHLEPWEIQYSSSKDLHSEAGDKRGGKASRSHSRRVSPEPGFGRGDKDGFPALSAATPKEAALTTMSYSKGQRYSPAPSPRQLSVALPQHFDGHLSVETGNRANSHDSTVQRPDAMTLQLGHRQRRGEGSRSLSRSRKREPSYPSIVEKDISMTMRARTIAGYSLHDVSF